MSLIDTVRAEARLAPVSGIEAVANYGRDRAGLIPLWSGEGDLPTPDFINSAAMRGLANGETFYTWQGGIPELRQALARYHKRHFGMDFRRGRIPRHRSAACRRSSWRCRRRRVPATRRST